MAVHHYLNYKNPFVRRGSEMLLAAPRMLRRIRATKADRLDRPTVLANSVPKSGTHLLNEVVQGLPARENYGAFLSSMGRSHQFRQRSEKNTLRFINSFVPGEVVRAHLFHRSTYAQALADNNVVHYFIYRDPRDVIVSSSQYLRGMNRWHRLHRHVCHADDEQALLLLIQGFDDANSKVALPNIAARIRSYSGWLSDPNTYSIRFEDLLTERRDEILRAMARFYAEKATMPVDVGRIADQMAHAIDPGKSHTFRRGKTGEWRNAFTPACISSFKEVAGSLLVELGYESDLQW